MEEKSFSTISLLGPKKSTFWLLEERKDPEEEKNAVLRRERNIKEQKVACYACSTEG
jgi:hypothetical protein